MKNIKESDLYQPVKKFFEIEGYTVKGEVKDCDVMAVKDDIIVVVELKTILNLDVILQAAIRQRLTDLVYIAVPKKYKTLKTKRWKNIIYLLRRLEIGLLLVNFKGEFVETILHPEPFSRDMSQKLASRKRKQALKEFNERHGDFNTGGVTGQKILTAYKEKAIHIATLLNNHELLSIKELKEMGTCEKKTSNILQDNHYGWFKRVSRGVYSLTDKGKRQLSNFDELVNYYNQKP